MKRAFSLRELREDGGGRAAQEQLRRIIRASLVPVQSPRSHTQDIRLANELGAVAGRKGVENEHGVDLLIGGHDHVSIGFSGTVCTGAVIAIYADKCVDLLCALILLI